MSVDTGELAEVEAVAVGAMPVASAVPGPDDALRLAVWRNRLLACSTVTSAPGSVS